MHKVTKYHIGGTVSWLVGIAGGFVDFGDFCVIFEKSHGASNFLKSESSSPPWATLGRIPTILTAI